jgi:hypothetical protein
MTKACWHQWDSMFERGLNEPPEGFDRRKRTTCKGRGSICESLQATFREPETNCAAALQVILFMLVSVLGTHQGGLAEVSTPTKARADSRGIMLI